MEEAFARGGLPPNDPLPRVQVRARRRGAHVGSDVRLVCDVLVDDNSVVDIYWEMNDADRIDSSGRYAVQTYMKGTFIKGGVSVIISTSGNTVCTYYWLGWKGGGTYMSQARMIQRHICCQHDRLQPLPYPM